MQNLNIAINDTGADSLLNDIKKEFVTNTIAKLNAVDPVIKAIKEVWVGEDSDKFIADFLAKKKQAEQNLNTEFQKIQTQFTNVKADWAQFRNSNYQ